MTDTTETETRQSSIVDEIDIDIDFEEVRHRLKESHWPEVTDPVLEYLNGGKKPSANEWFLALKGSNGQVAIGYYQHSVPRLCQVTYWSPIEKMQAIGSSGAWKTGIPELIENADNKKVLAVPVPLERVANMGGYNGQLEGVI
jgi:hypothetical protein